jgi:hypothetical protein
MTKEEKFVVNPLEKYFKEFKRSGAKWKIKDKSKGRSEKGWDLQVERKNQVLLIEAKHRRGPFASILAGLTAAPLTNRPEKMKRNLYRSWAARVCWAIGRGTRDKHNMSLNYQNLFDYFARNLKFWRCYSKILKVKYIFFVDNEKVAKIGFVKMVNLAERYSLQKSKSQKSMAAENFIAGKLVFK